MEEKGNMRVERSRENWGKNDFPLWVLASPEDFNTIWVGVQSFGDKSSPHQGSWMRRMLVFVVCRSVVRAEF